MSWVPLALVILSFGLVSTGYNLRVPLYESPDEHAHARYVEVLVESGRLPEFDSRDEYESWQAPLYYALGAGAIKSLGMDPPAALPENPRYPGETQARIHSLDESFPYDGPVMSVHLLRAISGLFGAGAIAFIYATALLLFPERKLLSLTMAATAGLVPQFAFINGSVSNDGASVFFSAATVYFGIRYLRDYRFVSLLMAAIALSLGGLTKSTALIAGVVPLGALVLSPIPLAQKGRGAAVLCLLPLVIAGWFYARSFIIWGAIYPEDPFLPTPLDPRAIWDPVYRNVFFRALRESYWYWGGWLTVRVSQIVYDLLDIISVLGLAGVIVTFVSGRLSSFQRRALLLLALLSILALTGILYFSVTVGFQPQGRYLFVAQPGLAILMMLGLSALFSRNWERDHPIIVCIPALLLAINLHILAVVLPRAY
jgi:hypothetical protein